MGLKEAIVEMLRTADRPGLRLLASEEPRAMRHLLGRLWDSDAHRREMAAEALGWATAAHPDQGVDLVRRLMWGLNDESATNGVHGVAALGEIGYRAPELMAPFVGPLASYLWDEGLRDEIVRALARLAEATPEAILPIRDLLEEHLEPGDPRLEALLAAGRGGTSGGFDGT